MSDSLLVNSFSGVSPSFRMYLMSWVFLWIIVSSISLVGAQQGDECPRLWREFKGQCYRFSTDAMTVQMASIECEKHYATLVVVRSQQEHNFIQGVLKSVATHSSTDWHTDGLRAYDEVLRWRSDNSEINVDFFQSSAVRNENKEAIRLDLVFNQIVYRFDALNRTYNWAWGRLMVPGNYICQISRSDTWKIYQQNRDFSYGTGISDPLLWEIGPNITYASKNILFFSTGGRMTPVVLDCQASGNPRPTYRWFRQKFKDQPREEVTSKLTDNYVITNGRLKIHSPDPKNDSSSYTCEASNKLGTVASNAIELSYGMLDDFNNSPVSPTRALMYMGVEIPCQYIVSNTELAYNWFKEHIRNFIRPHLNPQYFLSGNGNLYISEVNAEDAGTYYCMLQMVPGQGQEMAVDQPPSRTSMPIRLIVDGESANRYEPAIQDRFPQVFPTMPLVGHRLEIECLAYGRLPIQYQWRREDAPLNPNHELADHNRRLIIREAQLTDTGVYTCIVKGRETTMEKSIHLGLKARPSFPIPLRNQHVDKGSDVTWRCTAIGVPVPTYTWVKNGQQLVSDNKTGITVLSNTLKINNVGPQHEGMYECVAENSISVARTSAQLRTLYLAPSFSDNPVTSSKQGAEGSDIKISCKPQAAPRANIRWEKDGAEVGEVMPNGDLHLTGLTLASAGVYTCVATNNLGEAKSSCTLTVLSEQVFEERPLDIEVLLNETAALPCKALFDSTKSDIVYSWSFNGHVLDLEGHKSNRDRVHYSIDSVSNPNNGKLYVMNAQYKHEGMYVCHVTSVAGSISSGAYVTVKGPPGEPGGVHAKSTSGESKGEIALWWQPGAHHGFDVSYYIIEFKANDSQVWNIIVNDLPETETHLDQFSKWRVYEINSTAQSGLSPGRTYTFRVRACSRDVGCSRPSSPLDGDNYKHAYHTLLEGRPVHAPGNLTGGPGITEPGKEGLLQIKWDKLSKDKWGSDSISYILYFMKNESRRSGGTSNTNKLPEKWHVVKTVRTFHNEYVGRDNFYLPYLVKVQAKNRHGPGPNSSEVIVYSEELLPETQPTGISAAAVNATAGVVKWTPVPDTRDHANGRVAGYQINYWQEGTKCAGGEKELNGQSINIYGNVGEGMVIGLDPGSANCINIQMYNTAGIGPKTDNYYLEMTWWPPKMYPEYIRVVSHGTNSVRLSWAGVSTTSQEEPIRGYRAWWWEITEDIRVARVEDFGMTQTGVIRNIEAGILYRVRMLAYSKGGNGTKSPDIYFTLGGQIRYDPTSTEVMNSAIRIFQLESPLQSVLITVISLLYRVLLLYLL